jgi:hypothetical protein
MNLADKWFWKIASKISDWHAFEKHIWEFKEFGIKTKDQLSDLVQNIMKKTDGTKDMKNLSNWRSAYWDDKTSTIVIHDPKSKDFWTVFRPEDWKDYFFNLK